MPRMAGGVQNTEWDNCARCGFVHPIGMLTTQLGMLVCKCHGCYDDLTNYYRAQEIAEILGTADEGLSDKPEQYSDSEEIVF